MDVILEPPAELKTRQFMLFDIKYIESRLPQGCPAFSVSEREYSGGQG